jgi:hypothetical protein
MVKYLIEVGAKKYGCAEKTKSEEIKKIIGGKKSRRKSRRLRKIKNNTINVVMYENDM